MERCQMTWPEQGSFAAFLAHRASPDPAEKTWDCPTCGTIRPREIKPGYYLPRPCPCEERQREAREMDALRRQMQAEQRAHTFDWIGLHWAEPYLEALTFTSFERRRQPQAFTLAQTFAQDAQGTLALTGSYGSGKTHLLAAIANARREANLPCLYVSTVVLFEVIQDRIHREQEYQSLLQRAARTPLAHIILRLSLNYQGVFYRLGEVSEL